MDQFVVVGEIHCSDQLNRAVEHHLDVLKRNPGIQVQLGESWRKLPVDQTLYFSVHVATVIELHELEAKTGVEVLELIHAGDDV